MIHLALSSFGPFQASLDGEQLTGFHSVKVQALLAYLALEADRPHPRETLATLLWPLDHETSARNSLRQALYELRKLLGDTDNSANPFLLVTRQTVQFNPAANHTLDVTEFQSHLQQGQFEQAAALYHGELLGGLSCESEPFEEWLRQKRAYFHNLVIDVYFKLTNQALHQGDFAQARTYAQRQLALEPWREEAHRQLMIALALSGERSAALAQYDTCRRVLADELGVEPDAETSALYEQIKAGKLRGQSVAPLQHQVVGKELVVRPTGLQMVRHNLPTQPTAFIGRQTDLAQIAARLSDPACRLLTIVGPGGMGKTRLAIQAAQSILDLGFSIFDVAPSIGNPKSKIQTPKFEDGVFFVPLAGVASPDLLVSTIATVLDFTFYGGGDPKTQLLDYLQARSLLLVLDNFEHLLDGAELVSELLAAAPDVKVLATSRESLNLREEWLHPLSGMSFPSDEKQTTPLESYTAVQFFVRCARQMNPAFDLAAEAAAVVCICRLVEGMPLGIELATSWLKLFSCAQIAREVEQSLDFLATTLRNVPARHRSMKAVFEHSWKLLSDQEQQVLQRLTVFRGGFDRTAAQQVAGANFPLLVALAEKSLIQVAANERYQLHELLRQFAEEKLSIDSVATAQVHNEHCRYYLTFLAQQEDRIKGPEQRMAMLEVEKEIENVRTAWAWAVAHEKLTDLENSLGGLYHFHDAKAWYEQGLILFQKATAALRQGLPAEGRQRFVLGKALVAQADLQLNLSAHSSTWAVHKDTDTLLEQSLALLQPFDDANGIGHIYRLLGNVNKNYIDYQTRLHFKQKALTYYESANNL